MEHVTAMISTPRYWQEIAKFALFGLVCGGMSSLLPRLLEPSIPCQELRQYEFLMQHDALLDLMTTLLHKLQLNGMSQRQQENFHLICEYVNILAGFECMSDRHVFLPLHTNYKIQFILHDLKSCYLTAISQAFPIAMLGRDICDCIDQLEVATHDIKHNVSLQMQIQVLPDESCATSGPCTKLKRPRH